MKTLVSGSHAYLYSLYMFVRGFIEVETNKPISFAGSFFAKALFTRTNQDEYDEEQLSFQKNDLLMVKDTGQDDMWEATMLSTGNHGLVPVNAMQPLPYPFYQ